jgi:glycosyltransferase involved in cell wall biosynthesis
VLFLGIDNTGTFEKNIHQLGLDNDVIYCGNIHRDYIHIYYSQSDFTILASKSEGFGLSIIEGFFYGLPCITFSDLDAIEDLYDLRAMYLVNERTDEALAKGLLSCISSKWDRVFIQKYAFNFSLENSAVKYISCYNTLDWIENK